LNYARFFVTTNILQELNVVEEFWIDGKKFSICIVENLEFDIANDACLVG